MRVEARQPGGTPSLDAVRSRLVAQVLEERHEAHLALALRALRAKYAVRVDMAEGRRG